MKTIKIITIILLLCLLGAQWIRPAINNPPVTGEANVPTEVKQVFKKACYDCHSNETKLLWFDKITPLNFLVAKDIRDGRSVMNFSNFDSLEKEQQKAFLFECLNQISFGVMPPSKYTAIHQDAKVSEMDIKVLKNYLFSLLKFGQTDESVANDANKQYNKWIHSDTTSAATGKRSVRVAPNGIAFMPEYKNWRMISQTERADNGTMRLILGNEIAIDAIQSKQTNPWPDRTIFAKIAWYTVVDSSGVVSTGAFKQVEFMMKDKKKYESTKGWGFARWINGIDLVPFGKDSHFASSCVRCHQPMKANDFVFTIPVDPVPPKGKVILTGADTKLKTSFTLFSDSSLVTWTQREDPHWYGGYIPGTVKTMEKISSTFLQRASVMP